MHNTRTDKSHIAFENGDCIHKRGNSLHSAIYMETAAGSLSSTLRWPNYQKCEGKQKMKADIAEADFFIIIGFCCHHDPILLKFRRIY